MSATHTETAKKAYRRNIADIRNLLDHLDQQMTMHEQYASEEGIDWGHVGTTGKWRADLIGVVMDAMGSQDEEDTKALIEETLADAHTKGA